MDEELTISYTDGDKTVVISGRLDSATAERFGSQVTSRCSGPITVDMTDLKYISSAGIRSLLLINKTCPVTIKGASGLVAEVLEISGIYKILG